MLKPVIEITTRDEPEELLWNKPYLVDYIQAVEKAGGQVRILPAGLSNQNLNEVFSTLDGLILSGGGDIDPVRFNGQLDPTVAGVIPSRDDLELRLTEMAVFYQLPILGICRGIQVMNVALGGSLYTDVPSQLSRSIQHSTAKGIPKETINHTVQVKANTWLEQVTGKNELPVNSRHHQGILELAAGLQVMATAPDGLIEAVQIVGHPFGIGVQWHPENMTNDPNAIILFSSMIQAALELM